MVAWREPIRTGGKQSNPVALVGRLVGAALANDLVGEVFVPEYSIMVVTRIQSLEKLYMDAAAVADGSFARVAESLYNWLTMSMAAILRNSKKRVSYET